MSEKVARLFQKRGLNPGGPVAPHVVIRVRGWGISCTTEQKPFDESEKLKIADDALGPLVPRRNDAAHPKALPLNDESVLAEKPAVTKRYKLRYKPASPGPTQKCKRP